MLNDFTFLTLQAVFIIGRFKFLKAAFLSENSEFAAFHNINNSKPAFGY